MNPSPDSHAYYDTDIAGTIFRRSILSLSILITILSIIVFSIDRHTSLTSIKQAENRHVSEYLEKIKEDLLDPVSHLLAISYDNKLLQNTPEANRELARRFIITQKINAYVQQLRLLDINGNEIVRVERRNDTPTIVDEKQLQNKFSRYYFTEGLKLKKDQLYVSPMDLNIEYGAIEYPYRPVMRFVLPVFSATNKISALLVANIDMHYLLNRLESFDSNPDASLMLLNQNGYWLYHKNTSLQWGEQLAPDQKFSRYYGTRNWLTIQDRPSGQFISSDGLFSFIKIHPPYYYNSYSRPSAYPVKIISPPEWTIISYINKTNLTAAYMQRLYIYTISLVLLLLVSIPKLKQLSVRRAASIYNQQRVNAYSKIIEESDELIYFVSSQGKILFVNNAITECYGYSKNELIGKRPNIFKSGQHPSEFYALLWNTVTRGEIFEGIFVNRKKDGSLFYEAKKIIPLDLDSNDTIYVSLGKNLNSTYQNKLHDLAISDRVSSGLQHHFNNILNGIRGYIDLAIDRIDNTSTADTKDLLQRSLQSAVRAEEIIAKISMINSISMREKSKFDLTKLLSHAIEKTRKELPGDITLTFSANATNTFISCDAELIITAINAIIDNAIDSINAKGSIDIIIDEFIPLDQICFNCHKPVNGKHLMISVHDNGTGIPAEQLEEIFDPFYSNKESAQLVGKTMGLGLTIVRSIIHLHNGHIFIESTPGEGTSVSLLLPLDGSN